MNFFNIKNILTTFVLLVIICTILTVFNFFDFTSSSFLSAFEFILVTIIFFIGGFLTGQNSSKKGWLEGLKFSLLFIILFIFLNVFIYHSFKISVILYYLILIISTIFGSMIGIYVKKR